MKRHYMIALCLALPLMGMAQKQLSLEEVKKMALENNIGIRSAKNAVAQARERTQEAFTLFFPKVSAFGLAYQANRGVFQEDFHVKDYITPTIAKLIPSPVASVLPETFSYSMMEHGLIGGVTAIQPVFAGGQIVNGNKLAKVGEDVALLKKETSANTVELTAEKYFWQVVSLKEKQKTIDAVIDMLKNIEKDADMAVKAGVAMRNDLLAVQLKQNEMESARVKLSNGLKLSQRVLAQYIGMQGQTVDVIAEINVNQLPDYQVDAIDPNTAVAATPEYKLLQKNVEAKTLQRKMETGKRMPAVGVGANYNYYDFGSHLYNNFGMVFATVTIPISDWWGGSHAIKRKRLAEQNAREQLEDNAQLLKIRIQKNRDDMDDAYKQLLLARKGIEQSEENLRLNNDFYHAGTSTINTLLDAQQKYQQCRDRYVDAYAQLQTKILEYKQSVGW